MVLAYHLVEGGTGSPVDLPLATFRNQLEELAAGPWPVLSLDRALQWLKEPEARHTTAVVLTFDDAFENFFRHALPVLRDLALAATLYVPVHFLEGRGPAPLAGAEALPPASWGQLRETAREGLVSVGSHSLSHDNLPALAEDRARRELTESRRILEDRLEVTVDHFAYPRALTCAAVTRLAAETYRTAAVAGGKRLPPGGPRDPWALPRWPLRRDHPVRLGPLLEQAFWLEERLAAAARGWRARLRYRKEDPRG